MDFLYKKICTKCKLEKEIGCFYRHSRAKDGRENFCKSCKKEYQDAKKNDISISKKKYYIKNIKKLKEYKFKYNRTHKDEIKEWNKNYRIENKEKIKENAKSWYDSLSDSEKSDYLNRNKIWKIKNKDAVNSNKNLYKKRKFKDDIIFQISHNIRCLILQKLRKRGFTKKSKTLDILGCTFEDFKIYLESKFEPWMNWGNRGLYNGDFNYGWDIDHIIPISIAENEDEIIKLNHYSNLQPLCSKINRDIKKGICYKI